MLQKTNTFFRPREPMTKRTDSNMVTPGSISYSPLGQKKPFLTIPDYFEIQSTFARNPNLNLAFSVTKRTKKGFILSA